MKPEKKKDLELSLAIRLVYRVMFEGAYSSVIAYKLDETDLNANQKNYVAAIALGTIENYIYLDFLLSRLVKRSIKKKLKLLLLLALYEMEYMPNNAAHITVNRYVEYAKTEFTHAVGFVNAVLRSHLREPRKELDLNDTEEAAIYYSHPLEIAELWEKSYGREEAIAMMRENNKKPAITIRVNTKLIDREELMSELLSEGLKVSFSPHSERALLIEKMAFKSLEELSSFKKGLFYIQDISSILFLESLDLNPCRRVLDLCAAPGGKSLFIAESLKGVLVSCDVSENKLSLIEANSKRLGLPYIERKASPHEITEILQRAGDDEPITELYTLVNDAAIFVSEFNEKFDLVLCDVPCSGLGVIRKKPEIKYLKEMKNLDGMLELQARILDNAAAYVAKNGLLVYSTCTSNPAENEERVAEFLGSDIGRAFELEKLSSMMASNGYSDGFFYAKMRRL